MKLINSILIWLLMISLAFGQLSRINISINIALYLHDFLAVILIILNFSRIKIELQKIKVNKTIIYCCISLCFITLFNWLRILPNWHLILVAILYSLRLITYISTIFTIFTLNSNDYHKIIISAFAFSIGLFIWLGYLQYFLLPDTRFLNTFGWDDHFYRLIGTIFDPAFTGLILVFLCITIYSWQKKSWPIALGATLLALLLTYSRASYLAFIGAFLFLIWKQSSKLKAIIILVIFVGLIPFLPKHSSEGTVLTRTSTVIARQSALQNELSTLNQKEWIIGRGLFISLPNKLSNDDKQINRALIADNSLVFLLNSFGLVGIAAIASIFWQLRKQIIDLSSENNALIIALIISSQFSAALVQPFVILYLGICLIINTKITT